MPPPSPAMNNLTKQPAIFPASGSVLPPTNGRCGDQEMAKKTRPFGNEAPSSTHVREPARLSHVCLRRDGRLGNVPDPRSSKLPSLNGRKLTEKAPKRSVVDLFRAVIAARSSTEWRHPSTYPRDLTLLRAVLSVRMSVDAIKLATHSRLVMTAVMPELPAR